MILDVAATSTIEVRLGEAQSATACDVTCDWVDFDATTTTPGATRTVTNGVTAVTALGAVQNNHTRKVNLLTVLNLDNVAHVVKVQRNDNGTVTQLCAVSVPVNSTLQFTDVGGFVVVPTTLPTGTWIKTTVLTAASGNHVVSTQTRSVFIRGQAGGGGGGGISTVTSAGGGGGGGSSGGYIEKSCAVVPSTSYAYVCGALGAGGTAGNTGTAGSDSTFTIAGTVYTCKGGLGGIGGVAVAGPVTYLGGASPAISTNGDLNGRGNPGSPGLCISVTVVNSGEGGSGMFGGGSQGLKTQSAGTAATGFGSGGSGACLVNGGASVAGGGGSAGCWIVDEYS